MQPQHSLPRTVITVGALLIAYAAANARQHHGMPPRDHARAPEVGTAAIKGRVVDAVSGMPVARARLGLDGPGGQRPSVLTDSNGAFAFANLPGGPYSLRVEKTGYLPGRYPEAGQTLRSRYRPLLLQDRQVVDGITVSLAHASAIAGRVVDAYGDPVEGAEVRVLRVPRSARLGRSMMRGGGSTNDLGEFRVARLDPDSYLLLVVPRSAHSEDAAGGQPVATYYPGVSSIDHALPVTLTRGQSATGLELVLFEGATTLVTGTVVDLQGLPVSSGAYVSARPAMKDVAGGWGWQSGGTPVRPDGTFRLKLAPGEYLFDAHATLPGIGGGYRGPGDELFGTIPLTVGGETVSGVTIPVGRGARVSGRFVFEGRSPVPSDLRAIGVAFNSHGAAGCRSGRTAVAANHTFTAEGLSGTCYARASAGFGPWTIKAILHEGVDLLDRPITFEAGQHLRNVQIVMTDRRTELVFRVADERGQPTQEYVAIVFPTDKGHWVEGSPFLRTYVPPPLTNRPPGASGSLSDGAGSAQFGLKGAAGSTSIVPTAARPPRRDSLNALPPGEYYVVALDDIDADNVRDPAVLDELKSHAVRVRLADGSAMQIDLRRLKLDRTP